MIGLGTNPPGSGPGRRWVGLPSLPKNPAAALLSAKKSKSSNATTKKAAKAKAITGPYLLVDESDRTAGTARVDDSHRTVEDTTLATRSLTRASSSGGSSLRSLRSQRTRMRLSLSSSFSRGRAPSPAPSSMPAAAVQRPEQQQPPRRSRSASRARSRTASPLPPNSARSRRADAETPAAAVDSDGRCARHAYVQLRQFSRKRGEWRILLDACPLCDASSEDKEEGSSVRSSSSSCEAVVTQLEPECTSHALSSRRPIHDYHYPSRQRSRSHSRPKVQDESSGSGPRSPECTIHFTPRWSRNVPHEQTPQNERSRSHSRPRELRDEPTGRRSRSPSRTMRAGVDADGVHSNDLDRANRPEARRRRRRKKKGPRREQLRVVDGSHAPGARHARFGDGREGSLRLRLGEWDGMKGLLCDGEAVSYFCRD